MHLSKQELLARLEKKLRGKSVLATLKKVRSGRAKNRWEHVKGLMSLGTHLSIELEQGHREYHGLLLENYEEIGRLIFQSEGDK